jgi:acyl transferase domain-containing protein
MLKAYEIAKLSVDTIDLMECHATGTPVGDVIEVDAMKEVFKDHSVYVASLKSNIGHAITASGVAATIKLLKAFEHQIMPATLGVEEPLDAFRNSKLMLLQDNIEWKTTGIRRAGLNNFGFGGNNAHMILEEYADNSKQVHTVKKNRVPNKDIAVVSLGVVAADLSSVEDFIISLFSGTSHLTQNEKGELLGLCKRIDLPLMEIKFPPNDLKQTLPQQLMILRAAREALRKVNKFDNATTGTYIGMQTDTTGTLYGIACRFKDWAKKIENYLGLEDVDLEGWVNDVKKTICTYQTAASVLGAMPNIVANRISNQYDFRCPSFTISAEELSGKRALDIAIRALRSKEIDVAVVGAVDMCCNEFHANAARCVLEEHKHTPGDAAVAIILKRVEDARKDGDKIYSIISSSIKSEPTLTISNENQNSFINSYGYSYSAMGLLNIFAAVLACNYRALPSFKNSTAKPFLAHNKILSVEVKTD